jgi:hypothetical protein
MRFWRNWPALDVATLKSLGRSAAVLVESDRLDRLEAMIAELGPAVERK